MDNIEQKKTPVRKTMKSTGVYVRRPCLFGTGKAERTRARKYYIYCTIIVEGIYIFIC